MTSGLRSRTASPPFAETQDYEQLRSELRQTLERLRATRHDGEARRLALRGFQATLRGVQARIDFHENDRGNIEAATRDARRANAELGKAAKLLRAAGPCWAPAWGA